MPTSDPNRTTPEDSKTNATFVPPPDEQARLAAESGRVAVPGFEVGSVLGHGAFGVVYKARQTGLNRAVALKMLLAGQYASPTVRARFLLEAESVAALEHPGIVKVFAFGESANRPYLAMELLPGGTLAQRIKKGGPLPATEAATLVAKLALAVAHAHSRGVVHRDIKPGNVLLTAEGEPRLTDFGLAKVGRSDMTVTGQVLGTPAYMAPEQAAGKIHEVGTAADVYALGALLYDVLTARPPFLGDSAMVTLQKVMTEEPERPRKLNAAIPHDLETICLKCLEKDPDRRYPTVAALAEDLERFLAGRPILARSVGWSARAAKWVRRNPIPTAALVLLSFAVAALGAAWQAQARAAQLERAANTATQNEVAERERRLDLERASLQRERLRAIETNLRGGGRQQGLLDLADVEKGGATIPPEIRFLEVDALEALGHPQDARRRLESAVFPAEHASRRDLRLGDLLIGVDDDRARAHFEKALAVPSLPEADKEFARGMLAPSISAALPFFRKALAVDPGHFPARRAYCLYLLCSGQLPDAVRVAEEGALLYPERPDFLWALFLGYAFGGDAERAADALARVKPLFRADLHRHFDIVAKYLPFLTREFRAGVYGEPGVTDASAELARFVTRNPVANEILGFADGVQLLQGDHLLRLPVPCRESFRAVWGLIREPGGRDVFEVIAGDDDATARLAATAKDNPEGFLRFGYGMVLFVRAVEYQAKNPNDRDGFRERMAAAGAAFELASTSHGLIDARQIALEKAIFCFALAGKPSWAKDPRREWVAKGHELLLNRLRTPEPVHPVNFDVFAKSARNAGDLLGDYTTARLILADWERRAPDDLRATRLRAEVEFKALAYLPALRAADKVLAKNPDDAVVRNIAEQCRAKLRLDPSEPAPNPRPVK